MRNKIKLVIIVSIFNFLACKPQKETNAVRDFYLSYAAVENEKNPSLDDVLNNMNEDQKMEIKRILIEYNKNEQDGWLAKFTTPSGRVMTLMRDGSIK